jgi:hypothetical protein
VIVRAILKTDRAFSVAQLVSEFDEFEAEEVLAFVEQLAQVGLLRPLAMPPFE